MRCPTANVARHEVEESQADLEDRLATEFEDFALGGPPFGVLWITVDQAQELRKTHGARPAKPCWKRWSERWPTACGRAKSWDAGASSSC